MYIYVYVRTGCESLTFMYVYTYVSRAYIRMYTREGGDAPRALLDALLRGSPRVLLRLRPRKGCELHTYIYIQVYVQVASRMRIYTFIRTYAYIRTYEYTSSMRFSENLRVSSFASAHGKVCRKNSVQVASRRRINTYIRIYGGHIYVYTFIRRACLPRCVYMEGTFTLIYER